MRRVLLSFVLGLPWLCAACLDGDPPPVRPLLLTRPVTDRTYLRDGYGRYLSFHGVNLSGSTKVPVIGDDDRFTYVGKPFAAERAREEFKTLRRWGFDTVRLLVIWEGIEPAAKGAYDEDYLDFLRAVVQAAGDEGIYVLLDMHQDMFSRHLMAKYNHAPKYGAPGSLEYMLQALVPDPDTGEYNDTVQGDGAPRWAVQACLQEKDFDSPHWGIPRLLSGLDQPAIDNLIALYAKLTGTDLGGGAVPDWVGAFVTGLPGKFPAHETTDMLPFTFWGIAHSFSLDVARCYGCLFAGDKLFPALTHDGKSLKDSLQEAYAAAWARVAEHVKDLPNVLGYDLMNEPSGNLLVLSAVAGLIRAGAASGAQDVLTSLLGPETGPLAYQALLDLRVLPPDATPETLREFGLDGIDVLAALGMNFGFADTYLRPFYEKVGAAVLREDPDAVIFIEHSIGLETFLSALGGANGGIGGQWETPLTRPAGIEQLVFAPHWYTDIYPFIGFDQSPRQFSPEEVRYRDYQPSLENAASLADYSLGNVPVVFGEFGTYFNFNGGAEASEAQGYAVSAHFLDNYYEAYERMFASRMLWCASPENDPFYGDRWNHEDFSIFDWRKGPRAKSAWGRPHARALAGKPIATHFYSEQHYFDPDKGVPNPEREFEVRYASRETDAPTEIQVPEDLYPEGFYVWLSDGVVHFDPRTSTLYHAPSQDEPGFEHWVRLRPPLDQGEAEGWQYFIQGERVLTANRGTP